MLLDEDKGNNNDAINALNVGIHIPLSPTRVLLFCPRLLFSVLSMCVFGSRGVNQKVNRMATEKKTMVFQYDWLPILEALEPDVALQIVFALIRYDMDGTEPDIEFKSPLEKAVFENMLDAVYRNRQAYLEKCKKNKTNGGKGGRPKKQTVSEKTERFSDKPNGFPQKPNGFQEKTQKPDNDNDNDIDNVFDNVWDSLGGNPNCQPSDYDSEFDYVEDNVFGDDYLPYH